MLNRSHAQASPLYNKLQQKLMQTSHEMAPDLLTRFDWIVARYIRWCALHASGGGWMSDYDVFNRSFSPEDAEQDEKLATLRINVSVPAYVFYATQEHCNNAIKMFIAEPLVEGKKMLEESHILGVTSGLELNSLLHAKPSDILPRSGVMKNFSDDEESQPVP